MSDLLPCPFCGGDASHYYRSNPQASGWQHDVDHWVCCDNEDCWATMGLCESKEEATTAWNRRALPAVQPGHVNEMPKSEHVPDDVLTPATKEGA